MTVGELIQALNKLPQHLDVFVDTDTDMSDPVIAKGWMNEDGDPYWTEEERDEAIKNGDAVREVVLL